jgi:hypothetical protein
VGCNPNASDSWKARVLKMAERGELRPPLAKAVKLPPFDAEQSSLVRLAYSATRLHQAGLRQGAAWPADKSPLALINAALATAARNNRE